MSKLEGQVGMDVKGPAAPSLVTLPDVLLLRVVSFNTYEAIDNLLKACKRSMQFFCSTEVDHMLFRPLAFRTVPNVIFSAYSMNMPVGVRCWRNMIRRCCSLGTVTFEQAEQSDKAVLSEKKESRSTFTFLIDNDRECVYRVGGHYFFTVHELGIDEFGLEPESTLIGQLGKWRRIKPYGVAPNPLRYFSMRNVPWFKSFDIPCAPLFRIGGSDASFPYSEYNDVYIMLPFPGKPDASQNTIFKKDVILMEKVLVKKVLQAAPESAKAGAGEKAQDLPSSEPPAPGTPASAQLQTVTTAVPSHMIDIKLLTHKKTHSTTSLKWRWIRPQVVGAKPPARRSHSCTYVQGSQAHRLIVYGGGTSSNGTANMSDLWVLDTFLPTTQGQYIKLRDGPQPTAYDAAKTDELTVQWSKPVTRGLPSLGRFGHVAYFYSPNGNYLTDSSHNNHAKGKALVVYGGMRFGGSLGLFDLWRFSIADVDANVLQLEGEEMNVPGVTPAADLKGHSSTYIGRNLLIVGGSSHEENARERRSAARTLPVVETMGERKDVLPDKDELKELLSLDGSGANTYQVYAVASLLPTITTTSDSSGSPAAPPPSPCSRAPAEMLQLPPLWQAGKPETEEPAPSGSPGDSSVDKKKLKIYVLDAVKMSWSVPKIKGVLPGNRISHGAELWGTTVVLTGGFDTMDDGEIDRQTRLVKTDAERIILG